ncbi:hypothetical protein [Rhodococcus jostii]|uniref:Secreted protein n=1 Tax=Rhodococcus jostii TaxID=132919 RepID=A0A1H5FWU4_RHOJO|nr:hypothetical protein [Rhodococcus jostii]SEE07903.1 hypothetical protein SAMN04490220_6568 [Rhodococcus jostii]
MGTRGFPVVAALALAAAAGCADEQAPTPDPDRDEASIVDALNRWPLTVTDASGAVLENVRESGVDVFRRQPDGSWKIHVSHAFPLDE